MKIRQYWKDRFNAILSEFAKLYMSFESRTVNKTNRVFLKAFSLTKQTGCYLDAVSLTTQTGCHLKAVSLSKQTGCYLKVVSLGKQTGCYLTAVLLTKQTGCYRTWKPYFYKTNRVLLESRIVKKTNRLFL